MNEASSDNQRDKLQDDLKKEIKKLQRLREQVKTWQSSSDIKDKEKLNQYRKLIEKQMETFKDVERENKTKPHSKQGLSAEEKMDPKEKERAETLEWVNV
jgi:CCR4-NOT transcription complex subunit 3